MSTPLPPPEPAPAGPPGPEPPPGGSPVGGPRPLPWTRWGFTWEGWRDNRRGEWWLISQLLLLVALLAPAFPAPASLGLVWPLPLRVAGGLLFAMAAVQVLRAFLRLGPNLTPLPDPMPGAALVTEGIYRHCRHPLYQGLLVGALGIVLLQGSLLHLAVLLALAAVLAGKARREERLLDLTHPEYPAYRAATPAIVPWVPGLDWR